MPNPANLVPPAYMIGKLNTGELICKDFAMVASFCLEASRRVGEPLERIKLLAGGFAAGVTLAGLALQGAPPISMRIGETFTARLRSGVECFVEQVGELRTEAVVLIVGPGDCFRLSTHYLVKF